MLVRAQIIHDPLALLAEYHISVKTPGRAGSKVSNPSHGLSSVFVYIGVIPDGEGYRPAALRKHDPAHASDIEKWQGIGLAMPQFVHRSRADACEIVTAAEPEPLLNAGMEKAELLTKCLFVDRFLFFFQAEDGIRDVAVTGVQTCALPISCQGRTCCRRASRRRPAPASFA